MVERDESIEKASVDEKEKGNNKLTIKINYCFVFSLLSLFLI